jgi:hypothetical protein
MDMLTCCMNMQRHGLVNVGEILPDSGYYLLRTRDNARHKRSLRCSNH